MTRRNTTWSPLTTLQQAILKFIESKGPVTADQVREAVMRDHPLKDSSVRTLLRRLEARGLVSHTVDGKTFLYRADVATTSVAAAAVRRLIDGFWKGSAEQFLTGLVDEKVLSDEKSVGELLAKASSPWKILPWDVDLSPLVRYLSRRNP